MSGETDRIRWRGVQPIAGIQGIWPAENATRINKTEVQSGTGTKILYTVTANKKLFISSMNLTSRNEVDQQCNFMVSVRNDEDVLQYRIMLQYYQIAGQLTIPMTFRPALEAQAGWDVVIEVDTDNLVGRALMFGWEEDE